VTLLVQRGDEEPGRTPSTLHRPVRAVSIPAAIDADPTLGGVVHDCNLVDAQNYGRFEYNGSTTSGAVHAAGHGVRFLVAQPGPSFSVADVYAGWVEALRNLGQQVFEYNLDDRLAFYGSVLLETEEEGRFKKALTGEQAIELAVNGLYAAILKTRPHVLLVISAFFTGPELLHITRSAGVKVVVVHTESPYEDDRQLAVAHHADLNLVNDKISLDTFREISRAEYFPQAYRPSVHYPGFPQAHQPCDFAWVGTGFPSRVEFFEAMDLVRYRRGARRELEAPRRRLAAPAVRGERPRRLLRQHRRRGPVPGGEGGLNLYRREAHAADKADGWSMGPREVEMAACGLFFLRDPRPEGDEVLDMLPTFATPEDASEQLRWYLGHDGEREAAARKAREAIQDRTFDKHAARLLRLLEGE
jgi:spore maturation protein CgeB